MEEFSAFLTFGSRFEVKFGWNLHLLKAWLLEQGDVLIDIFRDLKRGNSLCCFVCNLTSLGMLLKIPDAELDEVNNFNK